jgi:hypothetical protein
MEPQSARVVSFTELEGSMEKKPIEFALNPDERQSDDTAAHPCNHELASAYAANSELNMEIMKEFAAVDQEGL